MSFYYQGGTILQVPVGIQKHFSEDKNLNMDLAANHISYQYASLSDDFHHVDAEVVYDIL